MTQSMSNRPISSPVLAQVVSDVINAAAIEETALANILNLEHALLQQAKNDSASLEEFVALNESVNRIIQNITKVQMMTQIKLQTLKKLLQKIATLDGNVAREEPS